MRDLRDRARLANAPQIPLFEAAAEGVINLAIAYDPESHLPREITDNTSRPLVVVVGDDPPHNHAHAIGPAGWVLSRRLQYWRPRGCLIHATGAQGCEYRTAVLAAVTLGRFLIVETGSAHARAWCDLIEPVCPTTVLVPPGGGTHPIQERRH